MTVLIRLSDGRPYSQPAPISLACSPRSRSVRGSVCSPAPRAWQEHANDGGAAAHGLCQAALVAHTPAKQL